MARTRNYYLAVILILSKLYTHLRHYGDKKINIFKYEGDELSISMLDEIIREHRIYDKLILEQYNNIIPATKEAEIVDENDGSLEAYKSNFRNFIKKEFCPACGLPYGKDPDKC